MVETQSAEKIHHAIASRLAKGVSYIEALLEYAKNNNIEVESIAEIVKKSDIIKEKVRSEAISMRLIKKDSNVFDICN